MDGSVFMRRVSGEVMDKEDRLIDSLFAPAIDLDQYELETNSLTVYDLQMWEPVQLALSGSLHSTGRLNDLPVFGGRLIGQNEEIPTLLLPYELVVDVANFLANEDLHHRVDFHMDKISKFFPSGMLGIKDQVASALEGLRNFYLLAAQAKQSVVKQLVI